LDNARHPGHVIKERMEIVALENAFLNGKIAAITVCTNFIPMPTLVLYPALSQSFRDLLGDALADSFPELSHLRQTPSSIQNPGSANGDHGTTIKKEEN
jgi:hypothetical protein